MNANREKNIAHAQRQEASKRPAPKDFDFTALDTAVRSWFTQEALSPFATCNS